MFTYCWVQDSSFKTQVREGKFNLYQVQDCALRSSGVYFCTRDVIMMQKKSLDCAVFKMMDIQAVVGGKEVRILIFIIFEVNISIKCVLILCIVLAQPALIM